MSISTLIRDLEREKSWLYRSIEDIANLQRAMDDVQKEVDEDDPTHYGRRFVYVDIDSFALDVPIHGHPIGDLLLETQDSIVGTLKGHYDVMLTHSIKKADMFFSVFNGDFIAEHADIGDIDAFAAELRRRGIKNMPRAAVVIVHSSAERAAECSVMPSNERPGVVHVGADEHEFWLERDGFVRFVEDTGLL